VVVEQGGQECALGPARWGFTDPAHFSRAFRAAYGMPPAEYRATMAVEPSSVEPTGGGSSHG
jgi:methylphosphotriester-DNA--protein-cysteine methyltransferase